VKQKELSSVVVHWSSASVRCSTCMLPRLYASSAMASIENFPRRSDTDVEWEKWRMFGTVGYLPSQWSQPIRRPCITGHGNSSSCCSAAFQIRKQREHANIHQAAIQNLVESNIKFIPKSLLMLNICANYFNSWNQFFEKSQIVTKERTKQPTNEPAWYHNNSWRR